MYIYQQKKWPEFFWDVTKLAFLLASVRHKQGKLTGRMTSLGFDLQEEAMLQTITQDVLKTSEIEGEHLNVDQVRSSVARKLGMDIGGSIPADRHVEGVVDMLSDATQHYDRPLNDERLFGWHAAIFPTGRSGLHKITAASWRTSETGAMQVVSGAMGKERVHFEAPQSETVAQEMDAFFD
jgi:Fic family protein